MKKTLKLIGLIILLVVSFIYTDNVFTAARKNDVVMKKILKYKKKNDISVTQSVINNDEIVLGLSGLSINERKSYKNMKKENEFDKSKIIYDEKKPKVSISKTYDYYIKEGNKKYNSVAVIIKVSENDKIDTFLSHIAKNNIIINFFVDGLWLENNVSDAFSITNLGNNLYNLGYNGSYDKRFISITNSMIESISMKKSMYCLLDKKDEKILNLCKKKKMHTIINNISNPSISDINKKLDNGLIISFDYNQMDINTFDIIIKTIISKGYDIKELSKVITDDRK